jgi:hypothetical protein
LVFVASGVQHSKVGKKVEQVRKDLGIDYPEMAGTSRLT